MHKSGGKGRISNGLVAASCAAILVVYAAGSWRTRDADRRFSDEGEMRRPARPAPVSAATIPVEVAASAPQPEPLAVPATIDPIPAPKQPVKADPAPSPPPAVLPQRSEPEIPVLAVAALEEKPEPEPEPEPESEPEATVATVATVASDAAEPAPPHPRWLDGYYTGWGTSLHGDIKAFVKIENDRIIDAGVASCETRYPCDVIEHILLQPIARQGPNVDRVSRATESADAYYYGLESALQHAEAEPTRPILP